MRVLVLCDDYWHPGKVVCDGLAPLNGNGWQFDIVEDGAQWSPAMMAEYSVVVFVKSNNITQENRDPWVDDDVQEAFRAWVAAGGGLLAIHSGTVYRDEPVMRALLGGAFIEHPKQCPVTMEAVGEHPLTAGVATFTQTDEHYQMAFDAQDADLFLTSTSAHGTQPAGWTRTEGQGRVCVLTPGHNVEVWLDANYQALLYNCLHWCAGS